MTLRHNLPDFQREARQTAAALREDMADRLHRLGVHAFEQVQDASPVRTGAYRAEHVVEQDGQPIYEHPDRPGPDAEVGARFSEFAGGAAVQFAPHSLQAVAGSLADAIELQGYGIVNRRFYAEWLENGTARMEPRRVYARAADATGAFAERLAAEPPKDPLLRGGR